MTTYNSAATGALATLRSINSSIDSTARTISTGLSIARASDGPAYWSIASSIRSDSSTLGAVANAISLGRTFLDASSLGLSAVRDNLESVQNLLITAQTPGADRGAIQTEIDGLLADMQTKANTAQVNGQNILSVDSSAADYNPIFQVAASFSSDGGGVTISTIDVDVDTTKLLDTSASADGMLDADRTSGGTTTSVLAIDISALTDSTADQTTLAEVLSIVGEALDAVIAAEALVGSAVSRASDQADFLQSLIDANDRAVGALVDADLEEESARLAALQTQQALAVEALAISNTGMANVLNLFR